MTKSKVTLAEKTRAERLLSAPAYTMANGRDSHDVACEVLSAAVGQSFERLHNAAHRAGMAAGNAAQPDPMTVIDSANGTAWTVPDGLCGFAWVKISARGSFARWALDCGLMRKSSVQPGAFLRVREFGQSMIRKEAYAKAYAAHLNRAGIDATYGSRLD